MTKKHKLSHAERETAAMLRNALKRAERVTNAQARMATHAALQAAAIEEEQARRKAAIEALSPAARELMEKQENAMKVSRVRFTALLGMCMGIALGAGMSDKASKTA